MKNLSDTSVAITESTSRALTNKVERKFTVTRPEDIGLKRGTWEMFQNPDILDVYAEHYGWDVQEHQGMQLIVNKIPGVGLLEVQVFSPEANGTGNWREQLESLPAGCVSVMSNQLDSREHIVASSADDTYSFVIDLRLDSDKLFSSCESRARKAIRNGKRDGLEVREAQGHLDVIKFHELMLRVSDNGKRFQVPPASLLKGLFDKGFGRLYLAVVKGVIVGGVYVLSDNYVHGLVSGYDVQAAGRISSNLLYWESLLAEKEKKCTFFDFGSQSLTENAQLVKFKRSFSPLLIPAFHYKYFPSYWRSLGYKSWQALKNVKNKF